MSDRQRYRDEVPDEVLDRMDRRLREYMVRRRADGVPPEGYVMASDDEAEGPDDA